MSPKHLITILLLMAVLILPASALDGYQGIDTSHANIYNFTADYTMGNGTSDNYCKGIGLRTMQSSWEFAMTTNTTTDGFMNPFGTIPVLVTYYGQYSYPTTGLSHITSATLCGPCYGDDLTPGCWFKRYYDQYAYRTGYGQPIPDIIFSVSETGNFTKKLSGVVITVSNGQSNTTASDGTAVISIYPKSPSYTYGATKTGYNKLSAQTLGGYGETGGTVFVEMESGTLGDVRTYIQAVDGATGGQVHYSNIQIRDVDQNLWTNVTNDFDGTHYIDTLPTSTIDAYADMTGYMPASRLGLVPFSDGLYEIVLWPVGSLLDPGPGNVNLIVLVNDRTTSTGIGSASVSAMVPSGAVEGSSTGTTGTVTFVVPNMSVIHVTAKKDGYVAGTGTIVTTAFGPDTLRIELTKATVTPVVTATPLPGEVTARPTYLPGCEPGGNPALCSRNQDSSLWAGLRRDAPMLYNLAFFACIVGLLFLAIKAMKLK